VDDSLFKRIAARLARSTSLSAGAPSTLQHSHGGEIVSASQANTEAGREKQTLEDLIVQTEIFLQYSLHNKALDRLQKIGVMFPGEEKRNARLSICTNWRIGGPQGRTGNSPGLRRQGLPARRRLRLRL